MVSCTGSFRVVSLTAPTCRSEHYHRAIPARARLTSTTASAMGSEGRGRGGGGVWDGCVGARRFGRRNAERSDEARDGDSASDLLFF
jgi:hypothetical protein